MMAEIKATDVEREPLCKKEELAEVERDPLHQKEPQAVGAVLEREPLYQETMHDDVESGPPERLESAAVEGEDLYKEPAVVEEISYASSSVAVEPEPLKSSCMMAEREIYMEEKHLLVERDPLYVEKVQDVVENRPPERLESAAVEGEDLYKEPAEVEEISSASSSVADEREPRFPVEECIMPMGERDYEPCFDFPGDENESLRTGGEGSAIAEREPVCMEERLVAVEREHLYMPVVHYVKKKPELLGAAAVERVSLYTETEAAQAVAEREPVVVQKSRERKDSTDSLIEPTDIKIFSPALECQMNEERAIEYEMPKYTEDDLDVLRDMDKRHGEKDKRRSSVDIVGLEMMRPEEEYSKERDIELIKVEDDLVVLRVMDKRYWERAERRSSLNGSSLDESTLSIHYDCLMAEPQREDEYVPVPVEPVIVMTKVEDYHEETDNKPMKQNDKFMYKECCKVKKIDRKRCGCGRLILDHAPDFIETAEYGDWVTVFDTRKKESFPREIYFDLNETSGNRATAASYVRLADDTNVQLAAEHHEKFWLKNYKPDILISFLGGCGKDFISKNTEDTLVEGISKLLHTTDSLFFTRASHTGLTKLVGRICNSHTQRWKSGYVNQCVGFMPWGCVAGRDMLDGREGEEIIEYKSEDGNFCLDPNHQEFFLVDDGTLNQFGTEVRLRSRLQQFLVNKHKIPSINLLLGGGLTSIAALHAAVFPESEISKGVIIPMVVLKNSGRAADVFSYVLESDLSFGKWKHRKYMKYRNINLTLATKSAALKYLDLDLSSISNLKALAMVRECVEKQGNKIFICDVEKADRNLYEDVQMASLEVSFFDRKTDSVSNLPIHRKIRIAMDLNQVKNARDLMRRGGKAVYYPMDDSLLRCNPRIVEELLDIYNFNVKEYVKDSLKHLYTSEEYKDIRGTRKVIEHFKQKYPFKINPNKTGSSKKNDNATQDETLTTLNIDKTLEKLTHEAVSDLHKMTPENITHCQEKINATQALLINSMLINQPSLTKVFWKYDKYNPLSNALLAYQLQCSIAKLYKGNKNIPQQLTEGIEYFKEKIVQLLTCYFDTDQEMASRVLSRKIPMWKNRSLVDVAGDFKSKFFIEQPASQLVVSKAWKGQDPDSKASLDELKRRSKEECCLPGNFFAFCHLIKKSIGTPRRKLFMHMLMYVLSVGIFSFYLLVKDSPAHLAIKWIMFVMVSSLALDEFRQVTDFGKKSFWSNVTPWFSDPWNVLDVICILLYYAGFVASFYSYMTSICIYSVFLALWCIKFTQFLRISSRIGPYMVMIFQMVAHMRSFLVVLLIAVIGYGVFMTALLFPNATANWQILFKVLFRPYFLVFGELGINSHELENSKTVFGTKKISRVSEIMVILGMAVFMLFANVLLLNLLIAAFSNIYETVRSTSYQIWRFEQFELLCEFKKKPLLPFPLSIPENLCLIFRYCRQRNTNQIQENEENREDVREIANFERFCMMKLWPKLSADDEDQSQSEEEKVLSALGDLTKEINESDESNARSALAQKEQLRKRVEAVKEGVLARLKKTEEKLSQRQDKLDQRLDNMERILLRLDKIFERVNVDFGDQ